LQEKRPNKGNNRRDIKGNIQAVGRRTFWQISLAFRIQKRMSLVCNQQ
jgi:hypothetical protein